MKKFVSGLLVLAMLVSMLNMLPGVAVADETLSVRILNDFEEATRTEAHSAIMDTGAQANSFEAGGYKNSTGLKMYNDNDGWLKYLIYSYGHTELEGTWRDDWQEAQYLQFYVRNEGPGVVNICLSSLKKDNGAMDHWQEYDITEAAQFLVSADGIAWTNLDKTLNGNGLYEIQIASGFEGFVRVAVNKDTLSFPDQGWGLFDGIAGHMQMTFGVKNTTVFVDDVALVGAFSDVVEGYQFDETEYFRKSVQIPDEVIRILNDFEEATRTEAHSAITDTGAQANSFEAGGYKGSTGLKMYNDNDGWLKYNIYSYGHTELEGTWRDDWQEAQYLQFYVRNEGPGVVNISLSSLKKDNGAMDHWQEYDITEAAQFLVSADGIAWTNLDKTLNGNGLYEIQIASGFEGFVRVAVNKDTLSFPDQGWGLFDGTAGHMQMTFGVKNTTVFVDDVALVGAFSDVVEGYQFSLKDYLNTGEEPKPTDPPATEPEPTDPPATEPVIKPDDDVRVLQDFTDASRTEAGMGYEWAHGVTDTYEAVGVVGSKALKLVTGAGSWWKWRIFGYNAATMGAAEKPWRTDFTGVEYIQFYVENQGEGTAHLTYRLSDSDGRLGNYEYYEFKNDNVQILIMSLDTGVWETAKATANADGLYGYTVPAGFKGLVRIEYALDKMESAWNNFALTDTVGAMMVVVNAEATTLILDEVAVVGDLPNNVGDQYTKEAYWEHLNGEPEPEPTDPPATEPEPTDPPATEPEETEPAGPKPDIIVIQDFTDLSRLEANMKYDWAYGVTDSYEAVGVGNSKALKLVAGNGGAWWKWLIYGYSTSQVSNEKPWRTNWANVDYVQFYVENQGNAAAHVTYRLCDNNGRIGNEEYLNIVDSNVKIMVMSLDTGKWKTVKATANADGQYGYAVPAGFKGLVRIEFAPEKMLNAWGNVTITDTVGSMMLVANMEKTTLVVDDVALVGFFEGKLQGHQYTDEEYKKVLAGEDIGTNQRVEVVMPDGLANIETILDFENGISDIHSGINQIPAEFSQSNEWSASGNFALKLVGTGVQPGAAHITQIQPEIFVAYISSASYLEFSVKNASSVPFGITWIKFNGNSSVSHLTDEISILEDGKWYTVEAYDDESFKIPAGYEGKIRIKIAGTVINQFEMAVKELTATAGATLYLDTFCLIGQPEVYEEVEMPADLDLVQTVIDFEKYNIANIRSGINFLPINFAGSTLVADFGTSLMMTTGTGGGAPNVSQIQFPSFYQNWSGGQYLELWISNPNNVDFSLTWCRINDVPWDTINSEVSLQMSDGKWYKAKTGGDADGAIIPAGFTGKVRVKLDEKFGALDMIPNMELGLYCDVELKDQKIYIDSIVIMGDLDQHIVPWVPNTVTEFPMDVIKEKIANGEKNIHFDVSAVIPVPTELLELIKGTDIVLSYTVLDAVGVPLYRWSLVGSELTDVTAFYPSVTLEKGAVVENALTKSFTVADGAVAGAYLSVYVREDFPSFAKLYLYDAQAKMLLRQGDQVHEAGWFTVSLAEDGSYLLADDKIESYTEPTDPEETKPAGSTPQTGDKLLNLAVLLMLTSAAVTGVMLRKRKEQ